MLVNGSEGRLGDNAKQRLTTMCNCYNGFEIAEEDLKIRGPGDFLALSGNSSIRQSGSLDFNLASTCEDTEIMSSAFTASREYLKIDLQIDMYRTAPKKNRGREYQCLAGATAQSAENRLSD